MHCNDEVMAYCCHCRQFKSFISYMRSMVVSAFVHMEKWTLSRSLLNLKLFGTVSG